MSLSRPTCSVVIVTRDRPDQLRRSVASVLAQSLRPQELIVIDDCSQYHPKAVVRACEGESVQFLYRRLPSPSGAPIARNEGAALASGQVLMFLDDDDVWEPGKIESQLRLLQAHPEVDTVYTGMLAIDDTNGGKVLTASRNHHSGQGWPQILFRNFMGPTSAVAVRTHAFRDVGGFDPELQALQDYDLWLRLCIRAPVLYDGSHNLRFCAISKSSDRISINVANYEAAFQHLQSKYRRELATLGPLQRRRFLAQTKLLLTAKHFQRGHYSASGMLLLQSIALYPPTLARLLSSFTNRFSPFRARRRH